MALTLGTQKRVSIGGRFEVVTPVTVDTSYPTGGWSLTPAQMGLPLGLVDRVEVDYAGVTAVGSVNLEYDPVNQKLMAFAYSSGAGVVQAEITNATNISTSLTNLQVTATGR